MQQGTQFGNGDASIRQAHQRDLERPDAQAHAAQSSDWSEALVQPPTQFRPLVTETAPPVLSPEPAQNLRLSPEWAKKVTVLGMGSYGLAILERLTATGVDAVGWNRSSAVIDEISANRTHSKKLPGVLVSENLKATADMQEAVLDRGVLILALPSHILPRVLPHIKPHPDTLVISLVKGFIFENWYPNGNPEAYRAGPPEGTKVYTPTEYLRTLENWKDLKQVAVASGPGFAGEIIKGDPFGLTVATKNPEARARAEIAMRATGAHIQVTDDVLGVEYAGAMKNVLALGVGVVEGLKKPDGSDYYGSGASALIASLGMRELQSIVSEKDGRRKTQTSFCGWPDLTLSTDNDRRSGEPKSRNKKLGLKLAQGEQIEDLLRGGNFTAEGVVAAYGFKRLSDPQPDKPGIFMPVVNTIVNGLRGRGEWRVLLDELLKGRAARRYGEAHNIEYFPPEQ